MVRKFTVTDRATNISIGLIWLFFLICNVCLPLVSDDFGYYNVSRQGEFKAIADSYLFHNARFGQLLEILYISHLPRLLFAFINSIIGVAFIFNLSVLIKGSAPSDKRDVILLWLILGLIISFNAFGSVFIWQTGAANYLHGFFLWSLCLIPYRRFWGNILLGEKHEHVYPALIIAALFAGWCFEQVGIITIIAFMLFFIVAALRKVKLPIWYYLGVFLFIAGYCILYFAPGETARGVESGSYVDIATFLSSGFRFQVERIVNGFQQYHSKQYMFYLFFMIFYICLTSDIINKNWFKYCLAVVLSGLALFVEKQSLCIVDTAVLFTVLLIRSIKLRGGRSSRLHYVLTGALLLYSLCCLCAALVAFPMRAKFGGDILLIISICAVARHYYSEFNARTMKCCSFALWIYMALACCFVSAAFIDYRIKWEDALASAKSEQASGNSDIVMSGKVFESFYPFLGEWENPGPNPDVWPNNVVAEYFGWDSIIVE